MPTINEQITAARFEAKKAALDAIAELAKCAKHEADLAIGAEAARSLAEAYERIAAA